MEYLYPKDCINIDSHLENNMNKRNRDISVDLPDLKRLKISDQYDIIIQNPDRLKRSNINIEKTVKISDEEQKKNKTLLKIDTIEKKIRLFKMCTSKYIDHLQDELDELKSLVV